MFRWLQKIFSPRKLQPYSKDMFGPAPLPPPPARRTRVGQTTQYISSAAADMLVMHGIDISVPIPTTADGIPLFTRDELLAAQQLPTPPQDEPAAPTPEPKVVRHPWGKGKKIIANGEF